MAFNPRQAPVFPMIYLHAVRKDRTHLSDDARKGQVQAEEVVYPQTDGKTIPDRHEDGYGRIAPLSNGKIRENSICTVHPEPTKALHAHHVPTSTHRATHSFPTATRRREEPHIWMLNSPSKSGEMPTPPLALVVRKLPLTIVRVLRETGMSMFCVPAMRSPSGA